PRLPAGLRELASAAAAPGLVLVGRRQVRTNNSWMGNLHALAKGRERCTLLVNPEDARRLGLADGGRARVRSRVGSLGGAAGVRGEGAAPTGAAGACARGSDRSRRPWSSATR